MPSPYENLAKTLDVEDGFFARTATLLSLRDISPNRQCRQLKKIKVIYDLKEIFVICVFCFLQMFC